MNVFLENCLYYFNNTSPDKITNTFFLQVNALACLGIALSLATFQRNGKKHVWWVSGIAYLLFCFSLITAMQLLIGNVQYIHPMELTINIIFCFALWRNRGNLARLICRGNKHAS